MSKSALVVLFYGLGDELYSEGMDEVAARLKKLGIPVLVTSHTRARLVVKQLIDNPPELIIFGGHSMGATAARDAANKIANLGFNVVLLLTLDLHLKRYTPARVPRCVSFHQPRKIFLVKPLYQLKKLQGYKGKFIPYERDDATHINLDNDPFVQRIMIEEIQMAIGTVSNLPVAVQPAELGKMMLDAAKAIDPANETPEQTRFNQVFFDAIRPQFGSLSAGQVDGMKMIVHAFDTYIAPKGYDDHLLAFVLGNVFNETGKKMQPVRETNAKTHGQAMAALDRWWVSGKAKKAGVKSRYWKDGYYGRGVLQETHFGNYSKGSALWQKWFAFALDFVKNPDLYLNPIVSALSAFIGSIEGKYTGKKFSDYCENGKCNFAEARRMINGDRNLRLRDVDGDGLIENMGDEIGDVCEAFLAAINKARGVINVPAPTDPELPESPQIEPVGSLSDYLMARNPDASAQDLAQMKLFADTFEHFMLQRQRPADIQLKKLPTNPPLVVGSTYPTNKGNNQMETQGFIKSKAFFKSKRIWGAATILAGVLFPPAKPFIDMLTPDVVGAAPEVITQLQEESKGFIMWLKQGAVYVGLGLNFWGSLVAKHKLTLK